MRLPADSTLCVLLDALVRCAVPEEMHRWWLYNADHGDDKEDSSSAGYRDALAMAEEDPAPGS